MSIRPGDVFSDQETQTLILAYMHSRSPDSVAPADVKAFLDACLHAVVIGQSVRMAADGSVLVDWDKKSGKFGFAAKARE